MRARHEAADDLDIAAEVHVDSGIADVVLGHHVRPEGLLRRGMEGLRVVVGRAHRAAVQAAVRDGGERWLEV